jgi:hypothetical protein
MYGCVDKYVGVAVRHAATDVMEGETMILTLKDSSLLNENGGELNEDADELENISVIEQAKRDKARKQGKKVHAGNIRGTCRDHAGNIQRTFRELENISVIE